MNKKVVFDCLGGDNGLPAMLEGAVNALQKNQNLQMVLVGDASVIQPAVAQFGDRVEIIDTKENIAMDEHPTEAIRKKVNSSIVLGLEQLKRRDDCGVFLSAGSTGAVLTGGFLRIGRISGVSRPALCPNLPTQNPGQDFILLDCGANMDCTPVNLMQFAVMGSEFKKAAGIKNPRIALLNVGVENTKGNAVVKEAFTMLTKLHEAKLINFVGNIEGDQVLKGIADVVVADGFWGNVMLKTVEGTVKFLMMSIKQIMTQGVTAKIGALFLGGKVKKFKAEKMDHQVASVFVGLKKPVVKMHGNSTSSKVTKAIEYAMSVADLDLGDRITAAIADADKILGFNE